MLAWLTWRAKSGEFGPAYYTPIELGGLYWHFVDIVWISCSLAVLDQPAPTRSLKTEHVSNSHPTPGLYLVILLALVVAPALPGHRVKDLGAWNPVVALLSP